jgi:hypothetical protein
VNGFQAGRKFPSPRRKIERSLKQRRRLKSALCFFRPKPVRPQRGDLRFRSSPTSRRYGARHSLRALSRAADSGSWLWRTATAECGLAGRIKLKIGKFMLSFGAFWQWGREKKPRRR